MHPVASLDSMSLCHTFPTTLWLPSSPPLVDIQVDSGTKLSCQSNLSLSLHASVSPSSALFVAVCSQLRDSCVQVLVVRCGMW